MNDDHCANNPDAEGPVCIANECEECRENAYPVIMHAVGMCDEYPMVKPWFKGENPYDCELQAGMVVCIESYMGPKGERDGVKLEQQVLITDDGYEPLTQYPFEESLLD